MDDYAKLDIQAKDASVKMNGLAGRVRGMEMRLSEIATLQKHISTYSRTREVYTAYRQCGYNPKFYAQHEAEIQQHKAAKAAFDATNLKTLPTIRELKSEYAQVLADKKKVFSEYQAAKRIMRELLTAKANVDQLLRFPATSPEKGTER